jgi:hypothetical protein
VTNNLDDTRRALRLLRWYPSAWRERYGEEFVDHMEQEFADREIDVRRAVNVAYKGLVARVGDIGLSRTGASVDARRRAAFGTSFVLTALASVFALSFWSRAMMPWNGPGEPRASVPDTVAIGVQTVIMALMLATLISVLVVIGLNVVRQLVQGRIRPLAGPAFLAVGSGAVLLWAQQYFYFGKGYLPVPWSHPGLAIKRLAGMGWGVTLRWNDLWSIWNPGPNTTQTVVAGIAPLAFLAFIVSVATLARRVELRRLSQRFLTWTVSLFGVLTASFFVSYAVWIGLDGFPLKYFAFPQSAWPATADLAFVALATVLIGRAGLLVRRENKPNHVTLVGAQNDG